MKLFRNPSESCVKKLLAEANLPVSDLSSRHLEHFWACGSVDAPDGVVGLEPYAEVALLRSLAVADPCRGKGYGQALVAQAERYARSLGVGRIYLLTTTAEKFFKRLGYSRTNREDAPAAIQTTDQFSSLCPSSSAFMVKVFRSPSE